MSYWGRGWKRREEEEEEETTTQGIVSVETVHPEITAVVVDMAVEIKTVLVETVPPEPTTVVEAVVNSPHREVVEEIAVEETVDVNKSRKSSLPVTLIPAVA
uniref:Uncharacterized protein n=1 Tax=Cacopsylla melanoneura TaxID=428564 RepID=A0A8D8Z8F7_9HEMI